MRRRPQHYKHPKILELIREYQPSTVVEFGSWYGKGTVAMALAARDVEIDNFRLYAVDTWLGSVENWKREPGSRQQNKADLCLSETGRPQFYDRFIEYVYQTGVMDMVVPLSMTTDTAWRWLQWKGIEADLIYIDASHAYEEVWRDIDRAQYILKKDGILCGDDYGNKEGVTKAVDEKLPGCFNREKTFWWVPQ